ncbi:MAG: ferrous iron transporter B [Chloracidobacterium sp.]|nr:ferrous iron transporter B [Chloracidobacterium sp.]
MDHCGIEKPVAAGTGELTVCLVGMPNSGKTTLMNALTGGNFRTGNYPGVTVSVLRGRSRQDMGEVVSIVDLPGIHSTVASSPEEELSAAVILGKHHSVAADVFVVVVDSTQIERHLRFAAFVARQRRPMVIALTMVDLLPRVGQSVNAAKLESALGVKVTPIDARSGKGTEQLLEAVRAASSSVEKPGPLSQLPGEPIETYRGLRRLLEESGATTGAGARSRVGDPLTERIDRIVLHPILGFPIFFITLAGLFAALFWAAQPLMDAVNAGFSFVGDLVLRIPNGGIFTRFLSEGIIHGIGVVAVFFPQVIILFFLMTLLEDSGYLARAAALADRPLRLLGLHGRSFMPMLSGFACAIPATLAARAIPTRRERLLTIWILPLMSCSARLPVYSLLLAAVMPRDAAWRAGLALAAIYVGSLLIGSLVAGLINRFLPRKRGLSMLAMELPIYRRPQLKPILKMTWARASNYLKRAGLPIATVSACLWLLSNFGFGARQITPADAAPLPIISQSPLDRSFAGQIGHLMEPALRPMGVDWRVGVGLISAFAAREMFVSSLAIVFHIAGDEGAQSEDLLHAMRTAKIEGADQPVFTTASILGLIVFFFFSLQCMSTVAVARKETNSSRFVALQLLFYTGLGYLAAVATVQGLRLAGMP